MKPPQKYGFSDFVFYALLVAESVDYNELKTYKEDVFSKDSTKQLVPIYEKIESLEKNQTWELIKPPIEKKITGYQWVFKRKEGIPRVKGIMYKTRPVAKSYNQIGRVNFNDVFSLVVKHNSIRVFLALVTMHDLQLEQLNVKIAFLHGKLAEKIYMGQSEGFQFEGKEYYVLCIEKVYIWLEAII